MFYRIKQFIWALSAYWKDIDYNYINDHLDQDEKKLFDMLSRCDKYHCFRVAKEADQIMKENKETLEKSNLNKYNVIKVCLLHDIGKINKSPNPIEKGILVILDKITAGNLKKMDNIKKIDVYYNHPKKGVEILKKENKYSNDFIEAIEKHHLKDKTDNKLLEIVRYCDNKN